MHPLKEPWPSVCRLNNWSSVSFEFGGLLGFKRPDPVHADPLVFDKAAVDYAQRLPKPSILNKEEVAVRVH